MSPITEPKVTIEDQMWVLYSRLRKMKWEDLQIELRRVEETLRRDQ